MKVGIREVDGIEWFYREDEYGDSGQLDHIEVAEDPFFSEFIKEEASKVVSVVCDIGFHIGTFSLRVAKHFMEKYQVAKIVGVEAEPVAVALGCASYANMVKSKLWKDVRVEVDSVAISGCNGCGVLKVSFEDNLANCMTGFLPEGGVIKEVPIQCLSLESWFNVNNIVRCDFLKVNCEGAEFAIFDMAPKEVMDRVGCIVCQSHPKFAPGRTTEGLVGVFEGFGFRVNILGPDSDIPIIVAKRR
jgi:FkbM family methyltransferase